MSAQVNNGGPPNPYTNNSGPLPAYTVQDVQAPAAADTSAIGASPDALLTPDALMAYCETRLNDLDSQMQSIFQQEQTSNQVITDIDNTVSKLNSYSAGFNVPGGDSNAADYQAMLTQLQALQTEVGPNTSAATGIQNAISLFTTDGKGGTDDNVSPTDITNMVKDLQTVSSDAGSNSQLNMINLQSLISQQQTAIQMCTNLVQALGQQSNAIATNIGK